MRKAIGCGFVISALAALFAQPEALSYRSPVDNSDQPYALYLPKSMDRGRKYPLVIGLHEEDSNHAMCLRHLFGVIGRLGETGLQQLTSFPPMRDQDFIVVCPFARGTMGYQGIAEQDVYDVLAEVKRRYPVDEDRVYLTGGGMGGGGALWLALTRPDLWAAVVPVCPATIPGSEDLAGNALNFPVRLYQGEMDPAVPAESSRQWHRRLLDAGVAADYTEFPGVRHNAWDAAYRNGAIFEWFARYKRERDPNHVHFATRHDEYRSAYWVRIDAWRPGELATVDAVRSAAGVRVETKNVDAFTLTTSAKTVTIDGTTVRLRSTSTLSFAKTGGRWTQVAAAEKGRVVGPILEAVSRRHLYVYGVDDEVSKRSAERAAAWSNQRVHINLKLPVKADDQVTADDLASYDLVLFGNAHTNRLIAKFAPQLPLALNPGAADYGLLFIAEVGGHRVLVNSGLPWWTGADEANRSGGYRFAPEQYRLLSTFGDYILFKGKLGNVLMEGRYDRAGKPPQFDSGGTVTVNP
jgi:pimeloyl-ACP methyl ester carboxylesterase